MAVVLPRSPGRRWPARRLLAASLLATFQSGMLLLVGVVTTVGGMIARDRAGAGTVVDAGLAAITAAVVLIAATRASLLTRPVGRATLVGVEVLVTGILDGGLLRARAWTADVWPVVVAAVVFAIGGAVVALLVLGAGPEAGATSER